MTALLDLFTRGEPIYAPIYAPCDREGILSEDWKTLCDPSTGQPWKLSRKKLAEWFEDRYYLVGKRFNSSTNYLMADIDRKSRYHPENDQVAFNQLLEFFEGVGLVRPVIVTSSGSGGLHLYFPLAQPAKTWGTAKKIRDRLVADGFTVAGGQLEIFPNPKERDALYQAHRLPMQSGSYLLGADLQVVSGDRADFCRAWELAAPSNELDFSMPVPVATPAPSAKAAPTLPPIRWVGWGQSNKVMRKLANWGYERLGLVTVDELGAWISEVAPQLPGYDEYTSDATKRDTTRPNKKGWPYRWAKSRVKRAGRTVAATADHNATMAEKALSRLKAALAALGEQVWASANRLYKEVLNFIQERFCIGISKRTFNKHKALWQRLVNSSHDAGGSKNTALHLNSLSSKEFDGQTSDPNGENQNNTVDQQKGVIKPGAPSFEVDHTPPADSAPDPSDSRSPSPQPPSESPVSVGRVTKAQLQGLPNPPAIMATGGELEAAGILGYGHTHTWTIRRGDYSDDLWNRLRYVAFGGT